MLFEHPGAKAHRFKYDYIQSISRRNINNNQAIFQNRSYHLDHVGKVIILLY